MPGPEGHANEAAQLALWGQIRLVPRDERVRFLAALSTGAAFGVEQADRIGAELENSATSFCLSDALNNFKGGLILRNIGTNYPELDGGWIDDAWSGPHLVEIMATMNIAIHRTSEAPVDSYWMLVKERDRLLFGPALRELGFRMANDVPGVLKERWGSRLGRGTPWTFPATEIAPLIDRALAIPDRVPRASRDPVDRAVHVDHGILNDPGFQMELARIANALRGR